MIFEYYQDKDNRDARYKELLAQGRNVFRSTAASQKLHPQYVRDFKGPEKNETGFGNTVYKTLFKNLYIVEEV